MEWRVPLADLDYGPEEEQAVLEVLHSRWLTMGAITQRFERAYAERLSVRHAIAVSNATVGLHLACLALGIGPGDEVIVPSLTFVATANAVLYTGAQVRFADITGPDDLTIAPAEIERLVTEKTRAIIPMHFGGYPCRMDEVMEIAARHKLAVIEDAAHAPGASLDGKSLGTWGEIGCFSFFSNKNLSTGEGGMVVTERDDLAEKLRLMRSHGMTSLTWDRHLGHAYTYDVITLGYNYRIDEIHSALGLAQLGKLDRDNAQRRAITQAYWSGLKETALTLPFRRSPGISAAHLLPVLLPEGANRQRFMDAMREAGVQTSIHYPPVHLFTYYRQRYTAPELRNTENVAAREVTLPLYPTMSTEVVDYVIQTARAALEAATG
jgi:dTDP-4-amino-4,6-dideoxygalactose transaminase